MTLTELRSPYPRAYKLLSRLVNEYPAIDPRSVSGLGDAALRRIEDGTTPERDVTMLLKARSAASARQDKYERRNGS